MSRWILPAFAVLLLSPCSGERRSGERAIWVADRGAGAVHRLGEDLAPRATARCGGFPRLVAALDGGGAWAACGSGPEPGDPFYLVRIERDGAIWARGGPFGWVADLAAESGGGAWVADRGNGLLVTVGGDGAVLGTRPVPGILCVERGRRRVLFGDDAGTVEASPLAGGRAESWRVEGQATDVREGRDSEVWILDASGGGRLFRLGAEGEVRLVASLGFAAEHLAVASSGVWVAGTEAPFVRLYAEEGAILSESTLPFPGDANFLEAWGGGVLVPIGAALVDVGPGGEVRRSRAGFGELAGIAVSREAR
ncbi:MAG TPA: hypothetical protein VFI25_17615 [Planctomycetota bacterium]|nr:hypothetical protein [Planctomycetota bacterium]